MVANTGTILGTDDLRVLGRVLKWLFALSSIFTLATAVAITAIEFDLNRDGAYCDDAGIGMVYLEGRGCSVNLLGVSELFIKSIFVYFIVYILFSAVIFSILFVLCAVRDRRHLFKGN